MAARRLLIIMLVLLGISSLLAIALPNPNREDQGSQETASTGETGSTGQTGTTGRPGKAVEGSDHESANPGQGTGQVTAVKARLDSGERKVIRAKPGTRLILTVRSKTASQVEIAGLGLSGFTDQFAPAVFDLLLPGEPGRYRVRAPGERPAAIIKAGS